MDNGSNRGIVEEWIELKAQLEDIKVQEMTMRKRVVETLFPNPAKGTQRVSGPNGDFLKLVYKLNYRLGDKDKINSDTGAKMRIDDQVFALQRRMEAEGEIAEMLADRLIKWTPALSESEYQKLDINDPIQRKLRDMIDAELTVEPAAPALEYEPKK